MTRSALECPAFISIALTQESVFLGSEFILIGGISYIFHTLCIQSEVFFFLEFQQSFVWSTFVRYNPLTLREGRGELFSLAMRFDGTVVDGNFEYNSEFSLIFRIEG